MLDPIECPKCGHNGPPNIRKPGGLFAATAELVPIAGDAICVGRSLAATLHCTKCGEKLCDSVAEKTSGAARAGLDKARALFRKA